MAKIQFIKNEAQKVEGLAYSGFETFRGSPYRSCAREIGQNSRDAAIGNKPVNVSFRLLKIARADLPFADDLQRAVECCLVAPRDEKTRQHLERARSAIGASLINILEISDQNTTGLTGPVADPTSVFAALVKGDGVTQKADSASAGSFGIGKNAAYAVSDLQTVVYSTCYLDPQSGEKHFAAQGRLRLISHTAEGKNFSAEGYWGNPNFQAIEEVSSVPAWMARHEIGTSIYSIGFREEEDWVSRIVLALVTNFFLAIERNEITFVVEDGNHINRATLDSLLDSPILRATAEEADQLEELDRARRLLNCARSEAAAKHTICIRGLGDFSLRLLVAEGLPREIHVIRNGIYITDNFAKFSQPMKRFPGTREFIALLEPARTHAGHEPSALLKQLENPSHDAFEPERIVDPTELKKARSQIKQLIEEVRKIIRSIAKMDDINHSQLDELSHWFAAGAVTKDNGVSDVERDPERFQYGDASKSKRRLLANGSGRGLGGGTKGKKNPRKKGTGRRSGTGTYPPIVLQGLRSRLPNPADARLRTIYFTPGINGRIELAIAASGLSGDVELSVEESSVGRSNNGKIHTTVTAGERVALQVIFSEPFVGPIELFAKAIEIVANSGG